MPALGLATAAALPGTVRVLRPSAGHRPPSSSDKLLLVSGLGGNVLALRGDEGLLLVDSGARRRHRSLQVAELKKFARGAKVHTVINTHWHADQTGGNEAFGSSRREDHRPCQGRAAHGHGPVRALGRSLHQGARKAAVPTEVFYIGSEAVAAFGGEHIEYGYLQQPHTDGDIYVYLRDSNVLLVGDAVAPVSGPGASPGSKAAGWAGASIRRRSC